VAMSTGTDLLNSIAIQSNGQVVGAGWSQVSGSQDSFAATRVNLDGTLDTTFGTGGTAHINFGAQTTHGYGDVVTSHGQSMVGGTSVNGTTDGFWVARLITGGTLDASFGSGGVASNDFGNHNHIFSLALLPSGKLTGAGEDGGTFAAVQYLANGTIDTAFGTG